MEQKIVFGKYTEEIDYLANESPKWEDNIKLDLNEIVYEDVNWIQLDQQILFF
jgi:hypothetical protein